MKLATERVRLPRPDYLVALKLHAGSSVTRTRKEIDWEEHPPSCAHCRLDPGQEPFRAFILRCGEGALERIRAFCEED